MEALKGLLEQREHKTISTDTLLELAHVVLKDNVFEFKDDFNRQLRGIAIGSKCAPLLVDKGHEALFKDKIFVTFRRANNFNDILVRAKLPSIDEELMEKGTFRCNGRRSYQICPLMREGDTFQILIQPDLFTISRDGPTATLIMLFTCCSVSLATRNVLEVQRQNFGKILFKNLILEHTHANTFL